MLRLMALPPGERRAMGEAGRERVKADFDLDGVARPMGGLVSDPVTSGGTAQRLVPAVTAPSDRPRRAKSEGAILLSNRTSGTATPGTAYCERARLATAPARPTPATTAKGVHSMTPTNRYARTAMAIGALAMLAVAAMPRGGVRWRRDHAREQVQRRSEGERGEQRAEHLAHGPLRGVQLGRGQPGAGDTNGSLDCFVRDINTRRSSV